MKLVIDIPEEYREQFCENRCKEKFDSLCTNEFGYVLRCAFERGAVLPKGHGALKDADKLAIAIAMLRDRCNYYGKNEYEQALFQAYDISVDEIIDAPTIIEADEEGAEECDDDCEHCEWVTCPKAEEGEDE